MRGTETERLAAIRAALAALPCGRHTVLGLPALRHGYPGYSWDLWAPGQCGCAAPDRQAIPLAEAAQQLATWRPGAWPRPPGEGA